MTFSTYSTISVLLLFSLLPTVYSVIFTKGRENAYDNGYQDTTTGTFQTECIEWHNYFRALHGAAPLTYSQDLERIARYRAIELAKKDGTNFYHHDHMDVGENLAWNSQEPIDCRIPLQLWYDEWKIYNFQRPHINARNGHFSQMVWKDTRRIGCGQAISRGTNGGTYTVCNYDPPGNWKNEELQNVSPPTSGVGIEFNPLGRNSIVQLPPISSHHTSWPSTTTTTRKITTTTRKWTKPVIQTTSNKNYYYYGTATAQKPTLLKKWSSTSPTSSSNSYPYDYSRYNGYNYNTVNKKKSTMRTIVPKTTWSNLAKKYQYW